MFCTYACMCWEGRGGGGKECECERKTYIFYVIVSCTDRELMHSTICKLIHAAFCTERERQY
jgi:hypothetical protein